MINDQSTKHVFAGADDGHYTLPKELTAVREAHERLDSLVEPEPPLDPEFLWPDLAQTAVTAFVADEPLPDVHALLAAARDEMVRYGETLRLHRELDERVTEMLYLRVRSRGTDIIKDHLQPALAEVVAVLVPVVKILPEGASAGGLIGAEKKLRDAWVKLESLSERYTAIRAAWDALQMGQNVENDAKGEFAEFANMTALFPQFGMTNVRAITLPPWPEKWGTERLLWLAQHGAKFIAPTGPERDKLWWNKYGEAVEQMRANNRALEAFRRIA